MIQTPVKNPRSHAKGREGVNRQPSGKLDLAL